MSTGSAADGRPLRRKWFAAACVGLLASTGLSVAVPIVVAPSAAAAAGCTSTSPALLTTVTCSTAGDDTITVPSGAVYVSFNVVGGGASGAATQFNAGVPADSGSGAAIRGVIQLPPNTASLRLTVGAGGAQVPNPNGSGSYGGNGGGGSGLFAYDASQAFLADLVVAGGGGGAGSVNLFSNAVSGSANGGNAGLPGGNGQSGSLIQVYNSGQGNPGGGATPSAAGLGGAAGGGSGTAGTDGATQAAGSVAAGGTRGTVVAGPAYAAAGAGGGGYFGGGGGGAGTNGSQSSGMNGGGGGGGSSYVHPTYVLSQSSAVVSSSGPGYRGSSGRNDFAYQYVTPQAGQAGTVVVTFTVNPPPTVTAVSPSIGSSAGGTPITITGTNFVSGATVTVGGASATNVTWINATTITATTPSGSIGARDVVVTNPTSETGTGAGLFTYATPPTVTAIAPATGPTAGGTPVTITGTGFVNGATVTIGGASATTVAFVSSATLTAVTPAGAAGAAHVVVTNPNTVSGTGLGLFTFVGNNPPAPTPPAMAPASQTLTGTVDAAVTPTSRFTLENFTMPVRYSVYPALPAGLTLDPATGVVSGTPTVAYPSTRHWITAATPGNSESAYSTLQIEVNAKLPSAPRDVSASKAGPGSAKVSWEVPASDGGAAITAYRVVSAPGSGACRTAAPTLTCTVTGLTNGTSYTFTVEAENSAGWGPKSAASNAVTPEELTPAPAPQPLPAPLDPGQSNLQTNGVVDPNVQVDPNNRENGLVITGDGWNMDLDGLGPDGKPLNLSPTGALRLANERDVATEGTGFLPNSEVDLYVDPPVLLTGASTRARAAEDGIYVGTVKTDSRGSFTGTATLPADITPGDHVLQAVGYSPAKQSRAMSLGVIVEPWIVLDQGTRKAEGMHDRMRTTGTSGGIDAGVKLTPWIRYAGQDSFTPGVASITVQSDGSFRWTREIKKTKGLTAYVSYVDVTSNRVFWAKVR